MCNVKEIEEHSSQRIGEIQINLHETRELREQSKFILNTAK